jgi:endoglucanase
MKLLVALVLVAFFALPGRALAQDTRGVDPASPNPLVEVNWWIDREWAPAWREYRHRLRIGSLGEARLALKIAQQPQFKWFGGWAGRGSPYRTMRKYFQRIDEQMPGSVPQIVAMRHEGRECHPRYTGGGARGDALTRSWWRGFARAIGSRRVVIGFEPDSLGTINCLSRTRRRARIRLLRYGVRLMSRLPGATVYLDAGASDWQSPVTTARKLRAIGVRHVRGFMLNATHMDWTRNNVRYGRSVSRLVGGKPFVINTSHNGNGPLHYRRWISRSRNVWRRVNVWCNPRNSALGSPPTTRTAHPLVDAYLWIERPGLSNGPCNGGPRTGAWWPERAFLLARRARW